MQYRDKSETERGMSVIYIRLFIRLFLGAVLLSTGVSKLAHSGHFRRAVQDYAVIPSRLEAKLPTSASLAWGIPVAELLAGLGLISGVWLPPATLLAIVLLAVFCMALIINLARGRRNLSCHCAGALGDHLISWWLVGRNAAFILCLILLLVTPADGFTFDAFVRGSSALAPAPTLWVNTFLPVALLVGM